MIERYQELTASLGHKLINEYDKKFIETKDMSLLGKANDAVCKMGQKETNKALKNVLLNASTHMKSGYSRSDN